MSRSKRNTIRLASAYTHVELVSDRFTPYIQLLRRSGVNTYTRLCANVLWSGTIGDDDYFEAPCVLNAMTALSGNIFICASLYDGYGTENNPRGMLIRCIDSPLSYYESQLVMTKPDDIGMSILINVK